MNDRSYTKLFSTIVTSSLWSEESDTRIVWITMLALSNAHGEIFAAEPGLARVANVSLGACVSAISKLESPDPHSRTKDNEGRRIEKIEGGWRILNYQKYRDLMSADERKEYQRKWDREKRGNRPNSSRRVKPPTTPDKTPTRPTQAEAEAEAEAASLSQFAERPSLKEVTDQAAIIGLAEWKAIDFWHEMEGVGWIDKHNRPIANWRPVLIRIRKYWEADGRPMKPRSFSVPANQQPAEPENETEEQREKRLVRESQ